MHVLLIHQAFAGTGNAGGTRHYELARRLAVDGHRFTIITSSLSYLTGRPRETERDIGPEGREDSVQVQRAWTLKSLHRNFVWRVAAFFSFMISSLAAGLRVREIDVVVGTSPPIFQAAAAWFVSFLKRVPFVLEVRDLWPEFAIDMGVLKSKTLIRLSRWLESFLCSRARLIIVNSPAYAKYFLERCISETKIAVVPNGVDPTMFDPDDGGLEFRNKMEIGPDVFVATYAGALGMANDIPTILQAAKAIEGRRDIRFVFVGDGKERQSLETVATEMSLKNVVFLGSVPKARIPKILAASDACLATLMNIPMFSTTYPNKVFDYMAAARPTVLGIDGAIREVMEAAGGGVIVPPGDSEALAAAVARLADDREVAREMGRAARKYVEQHFDRRQQSAQFAAVLEEVVGANG